MPPKKKITTKKSTGDELEVVPFLPPIVVGHGQELTAIRRARLGGRLAHAYLFVGQDGIGKLSLARLLAAEFLNVSDVSSGLFGAATTGDQAAFVPEKSPDYLFVGRERDAKTGKLKKFVDVAQARELRRRLSQKSMGERLVAILDGADCLNREAANALLKILEEPAGATIFMLAESLEGVLPTIRSRCQVIRLRPVPLEDIKLALRQRGADGETADKLARLSAGRPSLAMDWLNNPSSLEAVVSLRRQLLSFPAMDLAERWKVIESILSTKHDYAESVEKAKDFLDAAGDALHDAQLVAYGQPQRLRFTELAGEAHYCANALGLFGLRRTFEELEKTRHLLAGNVSPKPILERFALVFGRGNL